MFFINAEALGEDFFQQSYPIIDADVFDLTSDPHNFSNEESAELYSRWIHTIVIPVFNDANPNRKISSETKIKAMYSGKRSRDVHKDSFNKSGRLYVLLGYPVEDKDVGTVFPHDESYKGIYTDDLSSETLKSDFFTPPNGYAAVFDPDTELHAAPPLNRMVYAARMCSLLSFTLQNAAPKIVSPSHELCISPLE